MNTKAQIPLAQISYCIILIFLIILRIVLSNLNWYVNLANYISMNVSIFSIWGSVINKSKSGRNKNICKSVFTLFLFIGVTFGFFIFIFNIDLPSVVNDIFTLIALLFCICNTIFEELIKKVFSIIYLK